MGAANSPLTINRCVTPRQLARYWQVSPGKIIGWIRSGKLRASNLAAGTLGRPRFRISPEAIAEFEGARQVTKLEAPRRRRRKPAEVDYFP